MSPELALLLGFLVGCLLTVVAYEHTFRLASRYQRTGKVDAPPAEVPHRQIASSPEGAALRHVTDDSVSRGADQLLLHAKENGFPLTQGEARRQAKEMLEATDLLGGAR